MELYDLTQAQKIMFYSMKYSLYKQVINIPTSLMINQAIDFDIMKQALEIEIARNDSLRLRITKQKGEAKQFFLDKVELETYEILDFTGKTEEKQKEALMKLSSKVFKIYDRIPYKIYFIKSYDGMNGIYFNINHMVMDSFAVMVFYKDLFEVYFALKNHTELPKPLASYEDLVKSELAYLGSKQEQADIAFIAEQLEKPEPILTEVGGPVNLTKARKKDPNARTAHSFSLTQTKAEHKVYHITKAEQGKLFAFCSENQIPFQCLFLLGCRSYLSSMNGRESDISLTSTVARRGTLKEKRCGGTRIHFFHNRMIVEEDATFYDALQRLKENQNSWFRHINISPMKVEDMRHKRYNTNSGYEGMSFTYQPVIFSFGYDIEVKTDWYCPGYSGMRLYPTIMHNLSSEGGLDVHCEYQTHYLKESDIDLFMNRVMKAIHMGMEDPNVKIGRILDEIEKIQ